MGRLALRRRRSGRCRTDASITATDLLPVRDQPNNTRKSGDPDNIGFGRHRDRNLLTDEHSGLQRIPRFKEPSKGGDASRLVA
jgi:hypothetical protein